MGLNFQIRKHCSNEMKAFCGEVKAGQGRLLGCLGQSQHEPGFGRECAEALERTAVKEAMRKHPQMNSFRQFDAWFARNGSLVDRLGVPGMCAIVAAVALLSFSLSYCIVKRKFLPTPYNVV